MRIHIAALVDGFISALIRKLKSYSRGHLITESSLPRAKAY